MASIDAESLSPDSTEEDDAMSKGPSVEELLLRVPGAILHLIDAQRSVELAAGDLTISRVRQGPTALAAVARVGPVWWPLARDAPALRLDPSHYLFSLPDPSSAAGSSSDTLNYGLTFASKGQEELLHQLDSLLASCTSFSVQELHAAETAEVLDDSIEKETAADEVTRDETKREMMEARSAAYWTTLAPNVEEYSGCVAKAVAKGSGQVIKGIFWCGDVTVERLKWGNDLLKRRMKQIKKPAEISPEARRRMQRVKRMTEMSENVVNGILSGVVRVSGFVTSSIANSKVGRKFFDLLPGEIVLASLDGFGKICDAVEEVGKNVLQTSSTVTTGLVSHRYGEQAAEVTNEGLDAAGHAIGTAWAVFKIRKGINPKSAIKPATLVKAAAADMKAKQAK